MLMKQFRVHSTILKTSTTSLLVDSSLPFVRFLLGKEICEYAQKISELRRLNQIFFFVKKLLLPL